MTDSLIFICDSFEDAVAFIESHPPVLHPSAAPPPMINEGTKRHLLEVPLHPEAKRPKGD